MFSGSLGHSDIQTTSNIYTHLSWEVYNTSLATQAVAFHSSLYLNSEHITHYVNTYYLIGTNNDTIHGVHFNMWDWYVNDYNNGDGTVLTGSASLGDRYPDRTFFLSGVDHMELIKTSESLILINRLIVGNTSTTGISGVTPDLVLSSN